MTESIKLNKIRTSELTYAALDWVVATCEGYSVSISESGEVIIMREGVVDYFDPHRNWGWGGPIIEREGIGFFCNRTAEIGARYKPDAGSDWRAFALNKHGEHYYGPTPLIAAMRCYVACKFGDEVAVPDELLS